MLALHRRKNPPPKQDKNDDKKNPQQKQDDKDIGGQGGDQPKPPPRTRPQDSLSREDAERVLRAVADREKTPSSKTSPDALRGRHPKPPTREDW